MGSISEPTSSSPSTNSTLSSSTISRIHGFFEISRNLPEIPVISGTYSDLIRGLLEVDHIERGRLTCTLTVKQPASNFYGSLHGGAVSAVAELVSIACVKTVDDKDLFLGELATSYISAALPNAKLEVSGFVVRHGRNVTVTSVEFRIKETKKLVYTARATFYNVPVAKL